jgi:D-beta-D-heptose 7-phosphate kinase/D-beta-D-heptose 1-phosphate adenosyltransferase
MKIVVVSGGFDPLHSGHVLLLNSAKTYGEYLIVGVNSDAWLERKKGKAFMSYFDRSAVVGNLKAVDEVMAFDDSDGSACDLLEKVKAKYPDHQIIFANGGDRTAVNIPEMEVKNVIFKFGVGGEDKVNSSSLILEEWKSPKTERPWGYYRVLYDVPGTKVKELTINPGETLSLQRHKSRHEFWHVANGRCAVEQTMPNGYHLPTVTLETNSQLVIPQNEWHRIYNPFENPCQIIEVQYGELCDEADIERK